MANKDQVTGAAPCGRIGRIEQFTASAAIYPGDLVTLEAAGRVAPAAATNALMGAALTYASAAGEKVLVACDPDQLFEIQAAAGAVDAQTDIGLNYDIVVGTPNATYKRSAMELDDSTGATTATLPLRLLRVSRAVDNALGANVKCVVAINNHQLKGGTGAAGV